MKFLIRTVILSFLSTSLLAWPVIENQKELPQGQREENDTSAAGTFNEHQVRASTQEEDALEQLLVQEHRALSPNVSAVDLTSSTTEQIQSEEASIQEAQRELGFDQEIATEVEKINNSSILPTEKEELLFAFIKQKLEQIRMAPTMAFFRLFDVLDPYNDADGFNSWHGNNRNSSHVEKPLRLNDLNTPIRPIMPPSAEGAPAPIIKSGNEPKVIVSGKGYLTREEENYEVPDQIPTVEENKTVREIVKKTFQAFFSNLKNEELQSGIEAITAPEKREKEITPRDINSLFSSLKENEKADFSRTMTQLKISSSFSEKIKPLLDPINLLTAHDFNHYQPLMERQASLLTKALHNGTKGTLSASLPFFVGSIFGASTAAIAFRSIIHLSPCLMVLKTTLFDWKLTNGTSWAFLPILPYNATSWDSQPYNETFWDWQRYNGTSWDWQPYNGTYFVGKKLEDIYKCYNNPETMTSDIFNPSITDSITLSFMNLDFLVGALCFLKVKTPDLYDAIIGFESRQADREKKLACHLISAATIVSPLISCISAICKSKYDTTDDFYGYHNARGIDNRSIYFGTTLGTGVSFGLCCSIVFGRIVMDYFKSSTAFCYAKEAFNSWRFRNERVHEAYQALNESKDKGREIQSQIEEHFHQLPDPKLSFASAADASRNLQEEENQNTINKICQKILLKEIDTHLEQCTKVIEDLEKANTPQQIKWPFWNRMTTDQQPAYEMVPINDEEQKEEDPLSIMEQGESKSNE